METSMFAYWFRMFWILLQKNKTFGYNLCFRTRTGFLIAKIKESILFLKMDVKGLFLQQILSKLYNNLQK